MAERSPVFDVGSETPIRGGSDRTFGAFFAALFALGGGYAVAHGRAWGWAAVALAVALAIVAFAAPAALGPANRLWLRLGLLLARVVNPLVIGVLFFAVVTPIGLAMRALGRRPLRLRFEKDAATYWIERTPPGPAPDSMRDQF
jgi:hypothetical protein